MTLQTYDAGWVHADICARLERFSRDVADQKAPRLMLLMPPRHGKSELASIRFPAWHLGQYPTHEIINVGYNTDLPMVFSRKVRELVRDPVYLAIFPDAALDQNSQSIEKWHTQAGGGFTAAGVGGGITGKGAHILIIEDPIKNLPHKFRFQSHRAETVNFAINIMVAIRQTDVFHFRPYLDGFGRSLHRQIFDDNNGISILQFIAVGVQYLQHSAIGRFKGVPFVPAFWTCKKVFSRGVTKWRPAIRAWFHCFRHGFSFVKSD